VWPKFLLKKKSGFKFDEENLHTGIIGLW
jgi:hypothetical protein